MHSVKTRHNGGSYLPGLRSQVVESTFRADFMGPALRGPCTCFNGACT